MKLHLQMEKGFIIMLDMKQTPSFFLATALAAASAVGFCHADTLPASAYIQDGLVVQYDGIENAGAGIHDASATVWVDLTGNHHDLELNAGDTVGADRVNIVRATRKASNDVFSAYSQITIEYNARPTAMDAAGNWDAAIATIPYIGAFGWDGRVGAIHVRRPQSATANNYTYRGYASGYGKLADIVSAGVYQTYSACPGYGGTGAADDPVYVNGAKVSRSSGSGALNWGGGTRTQSFALTIGNAKTASDIRSIRIYNRQLTAEEIAINTAIDKIRFNGAPTSVIPEGYHYSPAAGQVIAHGDDEILDIGGFPAEYGAPAPAYGSVYELDAADVLSLSCPATWTNEADTVAATCTGWKLYNVAGTVISNGVGNTFAYVHPTPAAHCRLEWQWAIEYKVAANAAGGGEVEPAEQWVADGGTATVTATPAADHVFARWTGDVPAAAKYDNPLVLENVSEPVVLAASFVEPVAEWHWTGAGADALASNPLNWLEETAPTDFASVIFDATGNGHPCTWDLDIPLQSWKQIGYTDTVTIQTVYDANGFNILRIAGDCVISNGCWTHLANTSAATYRLRVAIGGKMTIGPDAVIHADEKGYVSTGPAGYKLLSNRGGTHGGQGSNNAGQNPVCYGSITSPEHLGGGSANSSAHGGGAIRMDVGGALVLDGSVRAKSSNTSQWHVPAGGSVWITSGSISGAGSVSADSGYTSNGYWGGGGRISLCLTGEGADFSAFAGTVTAYGSRKGSATGALQNAPGTIYYETAADGRGGGTIVIDAGGFACGSFYTTDIYLADQPGLHPKSIQSRNGAYVRIYGNGTAGDLSLVVGESVALSNSTTLVIQKGAVLDISSATLGGLGTTSGTRTLSVADGELRTSGALAHTNMTVTLQQSESLLTPANLAIRPATNGVVRFNSVRDLGLSPVTILDGGTLVANYPVTMAGPLVVKSGGRVTHDANGAEPIYAVDIATTGNVTVEVGGAIDVNAKGYTKQAGPGATTSSWYGPSHGGRGIYNDGRQIASAVCYGSISQPTTQGSGHSNNDYRGGGAIHLDIGGALVNDGLISADGNRDSGAYNPTAGGSVWITAGTMAGAGNFTANAAKRTTKYDHSYAGGGRISLAVTNENADLSGLTGAITAYGAGNPAGRNGGAGTVYLRTASQALDEGTLIIDNGLTSTKSSSAPTELSSTVLDKEVGAVIIRNRAQLAIYSNNTMTVSGSWTNAATCVAQDTSAVVFTGDADADIVGNNTFANLVCVTPGKKLVFASGSTTTVAADGVLQFSGTGDAPVVLRSSEPGTAWNLVADATAAQTVENVDVADSDASAGATITAINGVGANTVNWTFVTVHPGQLLTWTGAESDAWGVGANWDAGRAPVTTDRILIPAGMPHSPALQVATTIAELTLNAGATLSLAGLDLTVTGDASIAGTVAASATETLSVGGAFSLAGDYTGTEQTLVLNGAAAQTASFSSDTIYTVRFANTSMDGVTVSGALTTSYLACETAETTAIRFASGASVSATLGLVLKGTSVVPNLTLAPAASGTWSIKAPVRADVSGVIVSGGDASSGATIYAPDSTDGGGNVNWVFAAHEYAQWTGAVDSDFHTAGNWASGMVPGATDDVLVDGAATITAASAVSVNSIVLGGTGAAAIFTATAPVDVAKDIVVGDGGILSLNRPSSVTGSVILEDGAKMTHEKNSSTEANKLTLTVGGDMVVAEGAAIDVTAKGYGDKAKGPGATTVTAGGSYGGRAPAHQHAGLHCYGSIFCPTNLGSSANNDNVGQREGGGAIRLIVEGVLRVDGKILANGASHTSQQYYSGSGGSIYLTVRQLLGTGTINANGGNYLSDYMGGGGRIALYLTGENATPDDFGGIIGAYAGYQINDAVRKPYGSCGTVYYQTASQRQGWGEVVLDGGANSTGTSSSSGNPGKEARTEYPVTIQADMKEGRTAVWRLRRFARLYLTSDATVENIFLEGSVPQIDLNGHTLTVRSRQHPLGTNEASQIVKGGEIIWLPRDMATMIMLR
jgi:hypothetical protein